MYEELIKALHGWNVYGQHVERCNCELAAADAIESLTGQLTALQSENAEIKEKNAGLALALLFDCKPNDDCLGDDEWGAIKAALSRVEAERDAAIADIKIAASGRCCQICGQDCAGYEEISACTAFEWRGAQGEG